MSKINFSYIENKVGNTVQNYKYSIPIILKNKVHSLFDYNVKDKRKIRSLTTLEECCLYILISILHFNKEKRDYLGNEQKVSPYRRYNINTLFDSKLGCELSKEILSSVVSNSILYKSKNLLLDNNIISEVEVHDDVYYSKKDKKAIRYTIDKIYLDYENKIDISNNYSNKLAFLLKNSLVSQNKRKLLDEEYLPYDSEEKNYQYILQKQLIFDEENFKSIYLDLYQKKCKILNLWNYLNSLDTLDISKDNILSSNMITDFKLFKAVNTHNFKVSESHGRIYMPFQYMDKKYRYALKLNNMYLKEIFDMKCCFIQMAAMLYKYDTKDIENGNKIIELARNDIYQEIANKENISREDAKNTLMEFMFENPQTRIHKNRFIHTKLVNFFKREFPGFYNWLNGYPVTYSGSKCISLLNRKCTKLEASIMFQIVIPYIRKKYPNYEFLSLHDGIWSTENFPFDIRTEIENLINRYN